MTRTERAAFARGARYWRNEVGWLEMGDEARGASNEAHDATFWASRLPWPETEEVAEVAESLSLDGMDVRRVP